MLAEIQALDAIPAQGAHLDFPSLFDPDEGTPQVKPQKQEYYPFPVIAGAFPRIAQAIEMLWGNPELDDYLNRLIVDDRGDRQGFPPHVITALLALSKQHLEQFGFRREKDAWSHDPYYAK
jgi:hypothetical protein